MKKSIIIGIICFVIIFLIGLFVFIRHSLNIDNNDGTIKVLHAYGSEYKEQNVKDGVYVSVNEQLINSSDRGKGFRIKLCSEKEIPLGSQEFHLFLKESDGYKDITPVDSKVVINQITDEDQGSFIVYADITSLSMNEPDEGEYRIQFDDYAVDFRLSMIEERLY